MTSLADRIQSAWSVLAQALAERPHGFLAFSGGKDSTTLLVLAVEFLRRERPEGIRLEVLYADTRLEIPPMARHAFRWIRKRSRASSTASVMKGGSHERVEVEAVCGEPGNRSARVLLRVRQAIQARVGLL